jgi:molecular chaperone GrpE
MRKNIKTTDSLKKIKEEVYKYKNNYLRALADYQNFEKRVSEERERVVKNASKRLILKLLPVLDNIEKAQIFIKDQGLNIIKQDLFNILQSEGLEEIDLKNQKFNPELAEAVSIVDGQDDNKIIEIVRKGYKLNEKILRPAQVKVAKKIKKTEVTS